MGRVRASPWDPPWRIGLAATELLGSGESLLAEERDLVAGATTQRVAEFSTGRECARVALSRVGVRTDAPVLRDGRGAPSWPPGVVGSIAHCPGWTGAVAARAGGSLRRPWLRGVGLDAEPRRGLPSGVLEVVTAGSERDTVGRLAADVPGIPWDTVLFCAKEAAYKAWYPMTGEVLDPDAVPVRLSASGGFTCVPLGVRGRWTAGPRVVVTIAVLS